MLPRLLCEKEGSPEKRNSELKDIEFIAKSSPEDIEKALADETIDSRVYYSLGPDLNIVCYGLNFTDPVTRQPNRSLKRYPFPNPGTTSSTWPSSTSASPTAQTSASG